MLIASMHGQGICLLYFVWIVTDDYSRVKLLGVSGKGKDTDYINASYIDVSSTSCIRVCLCMYLRIGIYVHVHICTHIMYIQWIQKCVDVCIDRVQYELCYNTFTSWYITCNSYYFMHLIFLLFHAFTTSHIVYYAI